MKLNFDNTKNTFYCTFVDTNSFSTAPSNPAVSQTTSAPQTVAEESPTVVDLDDVDLSDEEAAPSSPEKEVEKAANEPELMDFGEDLNDDDVALIDSILSSVQPSEPKVQSNSLEQATSAATSSPSSTGFVSASTLRKSSPNQTNKPSSPPRTSNASASNVKLDEWSWTKYYNLNNLGKFQHKSNSSVSASSSTANPPMPETKSESVSNEEKKQSPRGKGPTTMYGCFGDGTLQLESIDDTGPGIASVLPGQADPLKMVVLKDSLSVAVLKSLLQKSVRRSRGWPSLRLAKTLMVHSFMDLLRRLTIICVEGILFYSFNMNKAD